MEERFDSKTVHEVRGKEDGQVKYRITAEIFDMSSESSDKKMQNLITAGMTKKNETVSVT